MGYSVYIETKNKKLQDKMYLFLNDNMKNYAEDILGGINQTGIRIAKGKNSVTGLSYANKNQQYIIGFDYSSWAFSMEKFYVTEITKWISKKIGDKKHYYYDSEKTKINNSFESKDYMKYLKNSCKGLEKHLFSTSITFIKDEVERLDNLWNKED